MERLSTCKCCCSANRIESVTFTTVTVAAANAVAVAADVRCQSIDTGFFSLVKTMERE